MSLQQHLELKTISLPMQVSRDGHINLHMAIL